MLQGVLKALAEVVEIAPPPVGRIAVDAERKRTPEGRYTTAQLRLHPPPVLPALAADEHARADVPVVAVDRRRPGERENYLCHGGTVPEAPCGAVAGFAAAGAADAAGTAPEAPCGAVRGA